MVGLIPHAPQYYTRMVSVATYHLFHLLFLNINRELLVFYAGRFLINYYSEFISQIVNIPVVWIMCCSHEIVIQVFSYIGKVHEHYPFRNCIAEPWILLVTVTSVDHHFFPINIKEVFFIIPPEPSKTQGSRISICDCLSVNNLTINFIEVRIIICLLYTSD